MWCLAVFVLYTGGSLIVVCSDMGEGLIVVMSCWCDMPTQAFACSCESIALTCAAQTVAAHCVLHILHWLDPTNEPTHQPISHAIMLLLRVIAAGTALRVLHTLLVSGRLLNKLLLLCAAAACVCCRHGPSVLRTSPTFERLLTQLLLLCAAACCCCRHGPKRAAYLADFWKVVDWAQVSKNFAAAKAGTIQALVA